MTKPSSARALSKLLAQRNEHPERLNQIDQRIRERFERVSALFVLDMCGFSRLTAKYGIIHYLAMIQRMQRVVLPLLPKAGGRLLKSEADNVFALFPDVPAAVRVALAVTEELARSNLVMPRDWDIHVSVGIGYGPLLMVGEHDAFGAEMNLASKLGEDLAEAEQILLTEAAWARMGQKKRAFVARQASMSGLRFRYYELERDAAKGVKAGRSVSPRAGRSRARRPAP